MSKADEYIDEEERGTLKDAAATLMLIAEKTGDKSVRGVNRLGQIKLMAAGCCGRIMKSLDEWDNVHPSAKPVRRTAPDTIIEMMRDVLDDEEVLW